MDKLLKAAGRLAGMYKVTHGNKFKLKDYKAGDTRGVRKERAKTALAEGIALLGEMQERLYAQDKWGVLLVFQAMDAAGKDGTIEHVMSGVNPQGCQVFSFKSPSPEELDHDYLWRSMRCLPERGRIGIFNRSYYEEVLVVRVHPEFLAKQRIPDVLMHNGSIWKQRFRQIRNFEEYLFQNGIVVRKLFLNVSRDEQRRRFLRRLDEPEKNWKFNVKDVEEREHWDDYMDAYESMIRNTATPHAPWFVVPADHKWYMRVVVAAVVAETLGGLDLQFPTVDAARRREIMASRHGLENGG